MKTTLSSLFALALLTTLGGCKSCQSVTHPAPSGPLLTLAPADAATVIWTQDLTDVAQGGDAVLRRLVGDAEVQSAQQALARTLGLPADFDPTSQKSIKQLGISPERGVVIFFDPNDMAPTVILGHSDAAAFDRFITDFAKMRLRADKRSTQRFMDIDVQSLERPIGDSTMAMLHWAVVANAIVLAPRLDLLQKTIVRHRNAATATPPALPKTVARAKEWAKDALIAGYGQYQNALTTTAQDWWMTRLDFGGNDICWRAHVDLGAPQQEIRADSRGFDDMTRRVPEEAVLALLTNAVYHHENAQAWDKMTGVPQLAPIVARLESATGLRPDTDVLPWFNGRMSMTIRPDATKNPFKERLGAWPLLLEASLDGNDADAIKQALAGAKAALLRRDKKIRERPAHRGKTAITIFEPASGQPPVGWSVVDQSLWFAMGTKGLDTMLGRLDHSRQPPQWLRRHATQKKPDLVGLLVIRFATLANYLEEALGQHDAHSGSTATLAPILARLQKVCRALGETAVSVEASAQSLDWAWHQDMTP